jgi:hypothetical protein
LVLRIQELKTPKVESKKKKKNFSLTGAKKLINITNSSAAAPKTWFEIRKRTVLSK